MPLATLVRRGRSTPTGVPQALAPHLAGAKMKSTEAGKPAGTAGLGFSFPGHQPPPPPPPTETSTRLRLCLSLVNAYVRYILRTHRDLSYRHLHYYPHLLFLLNYFVTPPKSPALCRYRITSSHLLLSGTSQADLVSPRHPLASKFSVCFLTK